MSVEKPGDSVPKLFHLPYMKNRSICRRAASLVCKDELQYKELLKGDNIRFVPHKGRWTIRLRTKSRKMLPRPIAKIPGILLTHGIAALVGMAGLTLSALLVLQRRNDNMKISELQRQLDSRKETDTSLTAARLSSDRKKNLIHIRTIYSLYIATSRMLNFRNKCIQWNSQAVKQKTRSYWILFANRLQTNMQCYNKEKNYLMRLRNRTKKLKTQNKR